MPKYKSIHVTYSKNPECKTLSVPLVEGTVPFGTGMTAAIWKSAAYADDFELYASQTPDTPATFAVFRTGEYFYLGFFFEEEAENRTYQASSANGTAPWTGDMAELHFGGLDPDPWLLQLGVGLSGGRFDSAGTYLEWDAQVFENSRGWGAEVKIPLSMLCLSEGGFRFNLCRQSLKRKCYSTWSSLEKRFHEVENFGQLLFLPYAEALLLRTGKTVPENIGRKEYEHLESLSMIPATAVTHGPYLSNPDRQSICISWETAGRVEAYLRYRISGSSEDSQIAPCELNNAVLPHSTTHFVHLTGLEPGATYEYEICAMRPVSETRLPSGIVRQFSLPSLQQKDFSFLCVSDLHSNAAFLRTASRMQEARKANFMVLLGDNLTHAAGREALYEGAVDPIVEVMQETGTDRPIVFVRGNHDRIGIYASEYFHLMRHPSGKTFYTFQYGEVFFIVLDCVVVDNDPYIQEEAFMKAQMEFQRQVLQSNAYREASFRVVLIHNPAYGQDHDTYGLYEMLEPLRKAEILPDLMLSGHTHVYSRVDANEKTCAVHGDSAWIHSADGSLPTFPWTVIVDSTEMVLDCEVAGNQLTVRAMTPSGDSSKIVDTVRIPKK